jgi:ABC-type branched-subunit amino acid transport system substrate-binding protein
MKQRCNCISRALVLALSLLAVKAGIAADDILIGNVASTTNPTARVNSANLILGYNVYFQHVNLQGGVHGRRLVLVNKDDGVNAAKMVELARELVTDRNVLALAGFLNTAGLTELIKQEILVKANIPMIAPIGAMATPNFYPLRGGYNDETRKILAEMLESQKKRVGVVYLNQAFGPPTFKFALEEAKKAGINVVATGVFESAPDKLDATVAAAVADVAKSSPDAVVVIAGGVGAYKFVKQFRESYKEFAQIYTLSPADPFAFVKVAGVENASGVIISQCIPYPQNNALAIAREYQKMMKRYAPGEALSFYGLEGYMGAKIVVEAFKRAGPNPTREKVIAALNTMKDFDLGDLFVSYTPKERKGSRFVELTIIGKDGRLYR